MAYYPDLLEEQISRMKRLALRYTGFKFYFLLLLCTFNWSALFTAYRIHALPSPINLLSTIWIQFVLVFWASHLWLFLIFTLTFAAIMLVNALEAPFARRVLSIAPLSDEDNRLKRLFRRLNRYLTVAFYFSFLLVVPVIHLWLPGWHNAAAFLVGLGSTVIPAWFALARPNGHAQIRRLGSYRFRGAPSFNTASMGSEAMEVKRELSHYERLREVSPINVRVRDYLRDGSEDFLWQGFHQFYENLAAFLQVPAVWITTHQNTTKAIRHALQLCVTDLTQIVATDLEFGSVLETISDIAPEDRVTIIKVRDDHLAERLDYRQIVDNLAERLNSLASSAASETRFVVVLSHVTYLTGAVLDLPRFRQKLTIDPSRLVLIIDGAQAAGNIQVGRSFLESCDFYASSGHKWLLGKTTLGILVHEPENIYRKLNIDLETIRAGTAPFSHIDYDMKDYTGETVDIEQIVSLNAMLVEFNSMGQECVAQHNRDLAREFRNLVTRIRGVFVVSSPIQSGIVSVRLKHARVVGDALERCYDYIGQALDPDILRFSFHYYMDQRDVYCLVDALNDVTKRQLTK